MGKVETHLRRYLKVRQSMRGALRHEQIDWFSIQLAPLSRHPMPWR
jgi:hypothetical protein